MSDLNQNPTTQDAENTSTDTPLSGLVQDVVGVGGELSDLPDVIRVDQPLEEALVKHNHLGDGLGFEAAAASRAPRVPMRTFEYSSAHYDITARVAPNNTIDFVFRNHYFAEQPVDSQGSEDPVVSASFRINALVSIWYWKFEQINKTKRSLLHGEEDKNFTTYTRAVRKLPYTFSINLKPLMTLEKMQEDLAQGGPELKKIHALVQLNLNPAQSVEEAPDLIRSLRINEEITPEFFDAALFIFKKSYLAVNFKEGEMSIEQLSIHQIRDDYLGIKSSSIETYIRQPAAQVEKKVNEPWKKTQPGSLDHEYPPRKANYIPMPNDRRTADNAINELQRQVRQLSQVAYERHEEMTGQLRTIQSQQAMIYEQHGQIIADNETLFKLMNLLTKALGVTK